MSRAVRRGEKSSSAVHDVEETMRAGREGDKTGSPVDASVRSPIVGLLLLSKESGSGGMKSGVMC